MSRPLRYALPAAAAALLAIAGCGDEDVDSGPAAVVPESAPVYLDVSLRPEGEAREGAEAALGRILDSEDPGPKVIELTERVAAAEGEDFNYEEDVEPWLGEKFAIFLTTIGGDTTDSEGGFVFETTDPDRALDYLRTAPDSTGRTEEYEGVEYEFDSDGEVFGAVDDFIVGGDEAAFKAAVDSADDESLADSDEFSEAADDLPDDSLATFYLPPERFFDAVNDQELDAQSRSLLDQALGEFGDQPVLGGLTASEDGVTVEFSAGGGGVETSESGLLAEIPAEAWLAVGFADVGAAVQNAIEQVDRVGFPGLDAAAVREQLRGRSGINLEQDVIEPLGDAAIFVQGTTQRDLGGALIIETSDPAGSGELLAKLQTLIAREGGREVKVAPLASAGGDQGFQITDPTGGLPQPIRVVQRDDRIIAGYGGAAVDQALSGAEAPSLSASATFKSAQEVLGDLGVDAFLSFAPVLALAESAGVTADPGYQQAKPYLDGLDFLAVGSGADDDRSLLRLIVGLK